MMEVGACTLLGIEIDEDVADRCLYTKDLRVLI
jgi:hypothetical protein